MKRNKIIINLFVILLILAGCNQEKRFNVVTSENYNSDIFYQNDLKVNGADPCVIYISEGEQKGYYYLYITSDDIGVSGYLSYRSKDMVNWEGMGTAFTSYKEKDEKGNTYIGFGVGEYWAPEVIYDTTTKLYYLFYTGNSYDAPKDQEYYFFGDIAVSEQPQGPFIPYNKYFGKEAILVDEKKNLYLYEPMFDFRKMDENDSLYETRNDGYMKVIDFSPFIDPKTGKKYAYFTRDLYPEKQITTSKIYVIELNDDFSPLYDKVHLLTAPNKIKVDDEKQSQQLSEGKVNEGAYCLYHNGKYYLLYSVCSYMLKSYSVHIAVGDSPIGPFTKLLPQEGGNLLYVDGNTTWLGGTGHCSVVSNNGHEYIVYHSHQCRFNSKFNRAIAFDELVWTLNNNNQEIVISNGPSYALLPKTTTGKYDVLKDIKITTSSNQTDIRYLNDGVVSFHDLPYIKETNFCAGKTTINIDFDDYIKVDAISIYNSCRKELMLNSIDNIKFVCEKGKINTGVIDYDFKRYTNEKGTIIPGGSFAVELIDEKIKRIEITISSDKDFALSEIMIINH